VSAFYREFESQAQIDAQYNPSLRLSDSAAPGRHYAALAHRARELLPNVPDVPYGATVHETLDIFPAGYKSAPVFIFIHGGYWRALTSKDFSGVALGLQAAGITTVVVNYALCPFVSIDEISRQARAAVAWTLRNIGSYGGDPGRLAIGGHSAGGHLTAMCLLADWAGDYGLGAHPIRAGLLISGLYDLEPLRYSYLQPQIQLDDRTIRRNSPAFLVRGSRTPVWVTWGDQESPEFARQSLLFHQAWSAAGNASELRPLSGADHFSVVHGFESADSEVCRWLVQALAP
jgi:arylformamidase